MQSEKDILKNNGTQFHEKNSSQTVNHGGRLRKEKAKVIKDSEWTMNILVLIVLLSKCFAEK